MRFTTIMGVNYSTHCTSTTGMYIDTVQNKVACININKIYTAIIVEKNILHSYHQICLYYTLGNGTIVLYYMKDPYISYFSASLIFSYNTADKFTRNTVPVLCTSAHCEGIIFRY